MSDQCGMATGHQLPTQAEVAMIVRDDLPETPDWMTQARPAIERLEAHWFSLDESKPRACQLCKQQLDGRGDS